MKRKIFLPIGILSLLLLPLLCVSYLEYHNAFQTYSVLEFHYFSSKAIEKMHPELRPILPQRDYQLVELTGNDIEDQVKLDYVQSYIRKMITQQDSIHGIHLVLKDQAKYASLEPIRKLQENGNFERHDSSKIPSP